MALNKTTLATSIKTALNNAHGVTPPPASDTTLANAIADAVDLYVKAALVSTVTTCPAGAGTGTGTVS